MTVWDFAFFMLKYFWIFTILAIIAVVLIVRDAIRFFKRKRWYATPLNEQDGVYVVFLLGMVLAFAVIMIMGA